MTNVPLARPWLGEWEIAAVRAPLESGWVAQGPEVAAFEAECGEALGASHVCAVSNGSAALLLALMALGIREGDEVITPTHSFIATANAIRHAGAKPVFVDIEPDGFNLDPTLVEAALGEHTKAIICVHQLGMPCDLERLLAISNRHGIALIEDAACAMGSEIKLGDHWERIGKPHGLVACFSLHPRKLLTTGEGGLLTTSDPQLDAQFRILRQHGMSLSASEHHQSDQVCFDGYSRLGYNMRLTDIQAAIGRAQLRRLAEMVEQRRRLAARYQTLLQDLPELTLPREPAWARSNYQSYCLKLPPDVQPSSVMAFMKSRGIATGRGLMNAHQASAYPSHTWSCQSGERHCACPPHHCQRLIHSQDASRSGLMLPIYHQLSQDEQARVVEALRLALREIKP